MLLIRNRDVPEERHLVAVDLETEFAMRLGQRQQEERVFPRCAFYCGPLPRETVMTVDQETVIKREPRHVPQALCVALAALPKVLNQFAAARLVGRVAFSHGLVGHAIGHCGIDRAVVPRHFHLVDEYIDKMRIIRFDAELIRRENGGRFVAEQATIGLRANHGALSVLGLFGSHVSAPSFKWPDSARMPTDRVSVPCRREPKFGTLV